MAVHERKRHQLYTRAIKVLGEEEAEILMAHLPPGGYPNLATKQDIVMLRQELRQLRSDLKGFTLWTILVANLVLAGTFAGIAFGTAGLS